jgi:hypothetical protein
VLLHLKEGGNPNNTLTTPYENKMPPLKNSRHEAFAIAVAKGQTSVQAYEDAGYSRDAVMAYRLTKRPEVRARIDELKAKIEEQTIISKAQVMTHVGEMALGKPTDKLTHKVKLAALQTAGDFLGMGKDKDNTQPINITIAAAEDIGANDLRARRVRGLGRTPRARPWIFWTISLAQTARQLMF